MKIDLDGLPALEVKFRSMNEKRWAGVADKNLTQMFNRGARSPGTPIETGELRQARRVIKVKEVGGVTEGSFGYTKDYGPHVEFGHRIVRAGRQVGYVSGQKFLFNNVQAQQKIYHRDMLKELEKE